MSLGIISFTSRGRKQAERLNRLLREAGYDCRDDSGRKAADWAGEMFREGIFPLCVSGICGYTRGR